jgi:hypothetical protein
LAPHLGDAIGSFDLQPHALGVSTGGAEGSQEAGGAFMPSGAVLSPVLVYPADEVAVGGAHRGSSHSGTMLVRGAIL